jgi:hypothetical protein
MLVHRQLVESVDLRRVAGSTGGSDFLGDNFHGCHVASREEEFGPLPRKSACDSATDRATGPVDHGNFVLQHHLGSFLCGVGTPTRHESRPTAETHGASLSLSVAIDVRRAGAVGSADTATPGKWARTFRPVHGTAGVYTWMDKESERRDATVER